MVNATNTPDFLNEIQYGHTCALNSKKTLNNFRIVLTVVDNCIKRNESKNMLIINITNQIIQ